MAVNNPSEKLEVEYADPVNAFVGHGGCDDPEWINKNVISARSDIRNPERVTPTSATRSRSDLTGCAILAVSAAILGTIAVCLVLALTVTSFFDKPDIPRDERLAKKAGLTEYRLRMALEDGNLTDREIAHAADGHWSAERGPAAIRIVIGYPPGPTCYQYEITQPTGRETSIRNKRLGHCPGGLTSAK